MRRLIQLQSRVRDETGASLVLIGISMVMLIGFVGLAIDAGALFSERRQLSRGADAVVLAIAEDCALGAKPCTDTQAAITGEEYADANAEDTQSAIDEIVLDLDEQTVFARTKSWNPDDGTDQFDLLFMPVLGFDSTTVHAEAKARWGVAGNLSAFPLIISTCEWNKYGPGGSQYPGPGIPVVITFHDGNTTEDCNAVAGQDADGDGKLPGGFGWLDTDGDCSAEVSYGFWADDKPGTSLPQGCSSNEIYELLIEGSPVIVPLFSDADGIQGQGSNGQYLIAGFTAFHVTGYRLSGNPQLNYPSSTPPCTGDERCIEGYFTQTVIYDTQEEAGGGTPPDYGVYFVELIG